MSNNKYETVNIYPAVFKEEEHSGKGNVLVISGDVYEESPAYVHVIRDGRVNKIAEFYHPGWAQEYCGLIAGKIT